MKVVPGEVGEAAAVADFIEKVDLSRDFQQFMSIRIKCSAVRYP